MDIIQRTASAKIHKPYEKGLNQITQLFYTTIHTNELPN